MAVNLGLDVIQAGYDPTTNSSKVIVTVTANWTAGSYNGYSPSGQIIVDGDEIAFNSNFNYDGEGAISSSGSAIIAQEIVYVGHNSDGSKTLDVSASFDTGISAGTVTTSTSKTLSSPNFGSGGDTGSGDSGTGGESGGNTGSSDSYIEVDDYIPTFYSCKVYIQPDEHTSIKVYDIHGIEVHNGDTVYGEGYDECPCVYVFFEVDDGYDLVVHGFGNTLNNSGNFESGELVALARNGSVTFVTVAEGPHKIYINKSSVCNVTIRRPNPLSKNINDFNVNNGDTIYDGEILTIIYEKPSNYTFTETTINGKYFSCYDWITVDGDVTVNVYATQLEEKDVVYIDNENTLNPYVAYIDTDGTKFDKYLPYITVRNPDIYDGLFKSKIIIPNGLNLRRTSEPTSEVLAVIPYGMEIIITEITVYDSDTFMLKTSYNNKIGWCSMQYTEGSYSIGEIEGFNPTEGGMNSDRYLPYLECSFDCIVNNPNGIYVYDTSFSNTIHVEYNTKLRISNKLDCWIETVIIDYVDYDCTPAIYRHNGTTYVTASIDGVIYFVNINDVYIQTEHPKYEWKRIGM